jgi:predicted aldo/keto reductase-like oxidoreductase
MKCINYVNSLPGVSVVLTGVKSVEELNENLKYLTQQENNQDFSSLIEFFKNDTN